VVVYTYYPSTQEDEAEDCEFETSLGYIPRPCLKRKTKQNTTFASAVESQVTSGSKWKWKNATKLIL
jgi:hypothetical protein